MLGAGVVSVGLGSRPIISRPFSRTGLGRVVNSPAQLGIVSERLLTRARVRVQILETSSAIDPATLALSNQPRGGENLVSGIAGDLQTLGIKWVPY